MNEYTIKETPIAQKTPAVEIEISLLGKQLEELDGAFSALETRLSRITIESEMVPIVGINSSTQEPPCSQMTEMLRRRNAEIKGFIARVNSILRRLEI